ncbi:hydroxymethylglutaryl-CoA lyase [Vibrio bivalvicida]|uniref:hydroxymethylglutaryl-CoA lyase n=1 Tax=Vibrio bivalvicida TaxID=1276888 RepID=A0A177XVV8_9VIBR|nr:hydroxymethylglutaryl-CoA lyase [Vibrio bivalvicida]OAJ92679.1 hydroxymethylglutaryl-CoA lyase [Vibrio bivalvicida]
MATSIKLPPRVKIVEVGPRDGLQNESTLPLATKVELIDRLSQTGVSQIESGAFVSESKIPQMANSNEVFKRISRQQGLTYSALTPNIRGLESAIDSGVDQVAVFTAASEGFCQRNINCSISQSLERFKDVIELASKCKLPVRGYLSCIVDCPYDGATAPQHVADITQTMLDMGCYEVSLGDTLGTGTPLSIARVLEAILADVSPWQIAAHFHDTYGQALANLYQALLMGVSTIDSSVAGLGGCPYATGAAGNVATEDVLYLCQGLGIETGIDLNKMTIIAWYICQQLNKAPTSKVSLASPPSPLP